MALDVGSYFTRNKSQSQRCQSSHPCTLVDYDQKSTLLWTHKARCHSWPLKTLGYRSQKATLSVAISCPHMPTLDRHSNLITRNQTSSHVFMICICKFLWDFGRVYYPLDCISFTLIQSPLERRFKGACTRRPLHLVYTEREKMQLQNFEHSYR